MEAGYNLGTLLSVLKTDLMDLIQAKAELFKLEAFEKTSKVGSFLIYGLVMVNVVFFALLFAFIALGFLFGEWVNNSGGGFAIVALIYLVLLVILFACRKSVITGLQNLFLKELDPDLAQQQASTIKEEMRYERE